MALADLSGVPILRGRITYPRSGLWHADLTLVTATDIAGLQTLNFSGTAWTCAYIRQIDFAGDRGVRVVAGQGGWRTQIPSKQYGNGAISTLSIVTDAAAACGEPTPILDPSIAPTVGSGWCRPQGLASSLLNQVLGPNWWVGTNGVVGTAPAGPGGGTPVSSPFQALGVMEAAGIYLIGSDYPNDWLPGATFSGPTVSGTISRITHVIEPETLRVEVMVVPA